MSLSPLLACYPPGNGLQSHTTWYQGRVQAPAQQSSTDSRSQHYSVSVAVISYLQHKTDMHTQRWVTVLMHTLGRTESMA